MCFCSISPYLPKNVRIWQRCRSYESTLSFTYRLGLAADDKLLCQKQWVSWLDPPEINLFVVSNTIKVRVNQRELNINMNGFIKQETKQNPPWKHQHSEIWKAQKDKQEIIQNIRWADIEKNKAQTELFLEMEKTDLIRDYTCRWSKKKVPSSL